ncbi:MAG: GIY-YIG nuclease family protein [Parcubacteria group bacterium]
MRSYNYYVYIMASDRWTLYIGVTNDLVRRISEHKLKLSPKSFTARYNILKLVYYEHFTDVNAAIAREKQLKNWRRKWKLDLIKENNPDFLDLSDKLR